MLDAVYSLSLGMIVHSLLDPDDARWDSRIAFAGTLAGLLGPDG